jgi:hypothetical protein
MAAIFEVTLPAFRPVEPEPVREVRFARGRVHEGRPQPKEAVEGGSGPVLAAMGFGIIGTIIVIIIVIAVIFWFLRRA